MSEDLKPAPGPGPGPGPEESNQRSAPRQRVMQSGLIVFRDGYCTIRCYILNISETGALLMPDDVLLCPKQFTLKERSGRSRRCEIVWRKEDSIGVRFL